MEYRTPGVDMDGKVYNGLIRRRRSLKRANHICVVMVKFEFDGTNCRFVRSYSGTTVRLNVESLMVVCDTDWRNAIIVRKYVTSDGLHRA